MLALQQYCLQGTAELCVNSWLALAGYSNERDVVWYVYLDSKTLRKLSCACKMLVEVLERLNLVSVSG
jgi:hypothetical protein